VVTYYNSDDRRSKDEISRGIVMCWWTLAILILFSLLATVKGLNSGGWLLVELLTLPCIAGASSRLATNYRYRKDAPTTPRTGALFTRSQAESDQLASEYRFAQTLAEELKRRNK
jgi:hypothetical protein